MDVLGETRMEGRGERKFATHADGTRAQAERPFGRDMNCSRREFFDHSLEIFPGKNREPNFRITRQRHGPACFRRGVADLVAHRGQIATKHFERAHNAIDLRCPCIGDDE